MFRRKPAPSVNLDADAYRRWLRARRPPLEWFLGLEVLVQEILAGVGDEESERERVDLASLVALATKSPERFEAAVEETEGDEGAETAGLLGLIHEFARSVSAPPAPAEPAGSPEIDPRFAGSGGSAEPEIVERSGPSAREDAVSTILGRAPDAAVAEGGA